MDTQKRREEIERIIKSAKEPISGAEFSEKFGVSRQVIVQDIAIIRASNPDIISTNKGYMTIVLNGKRRIFKVKHSDEQLEDELTTIVDSGGDILDVFVIHDIYGKISADLRICSRRDVKTFIDNLRSGEVATLKRLTEDYHFHTVEAKSIEILDCIEEELIRKGYIVD